MEQKYEYKILKIRRKHFYDIVVFRSHIATIEYAGKIFNVPINPTDKGTYGYDFDIQNAIYRKFHERSAENKAVQELMKEKRTTSEMERT